LFYYKLNKWRVENALNLYPTPNPVPCENCLQIAPSCFKAKFIIPVVVHVVHLPTDSTVGYNSNISEAQINSQMASLNQYFANYNNSDPKSVNTGIQFCVKSINRISNNLSNHNPNNMAQLMNLKSSSLDFKDYLHIYVVNEIVDGTGAASGIQGYATFPGANPQGVVMRYKRFGSDNGSNNVDASTSGNTLVHEIGHFLGLKHTFEGGCVGELASNCASQGDYCCDVPPVALPNTGCSSSPLNSCSNDVPDKFDMIQNHMDYSNDACRTSFTYNQTEIMHYTLSTLRSALVNTKHINALNLNCCSFSARFTAENNVLCFQDSVYFTALQYTSVSPTYIWTIKNSSGVVVHSASSSHYQYSWYLPSGANKYTVQLKVALDIDTATEELQDVVQLIDCGSPIKSSQGTWYFGQYAGLRFMQNAVIQDNGAYFGANRVTPTINTGEGVISVCDSLGNLLFYGGGNSWDQDVAKIFNQNHERAATKDTSDLVDIYGSGTSTQGILSFPNPTNGKQHLIFSNQSNLGSGKLFVSVFDTLESNYGKLLKNNFTKRVPAFSGFVKEPYISNTNRKDTTSLVYEQMTAVPQCNGKDHWLITIADSIGSSNSKYLCSYNVKSETDITPTHKLKLNGVYQTQGSIKVSPDGNFVAFNKFIYKFYTSDGSFTLWDTLILQPSAKEVYGLSFSSNSKVFYYIEKTSSGYDEYIWQLDLTIPNPFANRKKLAKAPLGYFSAMQLGPDGKIYISIDNNPYISVINKPNEINFAYNNNACDFQEEGVYTQVGGIGGVSGVGLPNMVDAVKPKAIIKDIFLTQYNCDSIKVSSNVCCATTYEWNFGDSSSLVYSKEANHRYDAEGTYNVTLKVDGLLAKTIEVKVGMPQHNIVGLSSVCNNTNANLYTTHLPINGYYQYQWTSANATITPNNAYQNQAYVKWNASGTLQLTINDIKTGCKDTATFAVEKRNGIGNNSISSNNASQLHCKKNRPDTIKGTVPSNVSANYSYGWLFKKRGGSNFEMLSTEKGKDLIPNELLSGDYKRFIYDDGCYHESNIVSICNLKNTITAVNSGCDQISIGNNPLCLGSGDYYFWQESNDSITWQEIPNTRKFNGFNYTVIRTEQKKWYRRVATLYNCQSDTSYSNIISFDPTKYTPFRDLDDVYTCATGGLRYVPLNFDALDRQQNNNSTRTYYRIKYGTNSAYAINSFDSATSSYLYNDLDTVYCIQTYSGCGSFKSRKAVIYKASNTPVFATHPSDLSLNPNTVSLMSVTVNNPSGCRYQWQYSTNDTSWFDVLKDGNNSSILFINNQNCFLQMYYRVKVYNGCGVNYSNSALLTFYANTLPNQADYWMKNSVLDKGNEPDSFSQSFAISQDIWLRHNKDSIKQHQDLNTESSLCYVYVTVRNRGKNPTQSAKLYTYWTWGATNESWKLNWTKNNLNRLLVNGKYSPMGGEINPIGISVPEIPANSSVDIAIPWTDFPKKGWYDLNLQKWENQRINICLLARIETCDAAPYGMTNSEQTDVFYNIKYNNNIVSRNTYTLPLKRSRSIDIDAENSGEEYYKINPNIIDGGTIAVRNNHYEAQKYSLCFKTHQSDYFTLAESYIELGDALKSAIEWSPNVTLSGLTHVVDNVYQVTSSNACINSLVLPAHFQDAVLPLFAYKDINNRFADGLSFNSSIQQKDSLGNLIGECIFTLTDNLFVNPEPTYIESDTSFYFCNDGINDPETFVVSYSSNNAFPTQIYNENGTALTPNNSIYQLSEGYYTEVSIDSAHFTHYVKNINVIIKDEEIVNQTELIQIDCEALPYQLNTNNESVIVYEDNMPMDSTSFNYYLLSPTDHSYKTEYRNAGTCQLESKVLDFMDILQSPPTDPSAYVFAKYDRTEDTCAFVRLSDLSCNGTPLTFGKTIDIYDQYLQYIYTATIEQYGNSTIGFKFCPPNWNTHEDHIDDWHNLIYKASLCEYCRIDFKADSLIVFDKVSSIHSIKNEWINLYPNPSSKEVTIEWLTPINEPITIVMFDVMGKEVKRINVDSSNKNLVKYSVEHLSAGVYHIYIPQLGYAKKLIVMKDE